MIYIMRASLLSTLIISMGPGETEFTSATKSSLKHPGLNFLLY